MPKGQESSLRLIFFWQEVVQMRHKPWEALLEAAAPVNWGGSEVVAAGTEGAGVDLLGAGAGVVAGGAGGAGTLLGATGGEDAG